MPDRDDRIADAVFREFIESSESILLIELDARGRICRTNPAAGRVLSRFGFPDAKSFAQLVLGLESADIEDIAARFSGFEESEENVVELGTPDHPSPRFRLTAGRIGDRLILFGEPSAAAMLDSRREMENLRSQFVELMRLLGRRALERRQLLAGLEEAERQLERHARTDPVTGLANRREFLHVMRQEWTRFLRYGRPYSVIVAQVEGLDDLTDAASLAAGEAALVIVAELIAALLRSSDYNARFGDRRFAVLTSETAGDPACLVARRLSAAVSERKIALPAGGKIGLVLGVSEALAEDRHPEEALRRATVALRQAVETGRSACLNLERDAGDEKPIAANDRFQTLRRRSKT